MSRARAKVLVTVGMSRYPFDRLISALGQITEEYDVFAQIGSASVIPPCNHARFVGFEELKARLETADVVVTHAGNTVRVVQSMERVPIAVARRAELGEMANDHQVTYLERERRIGRVIAVDDVGQLAAAVNRHRDTEQELLAARPLPAPVDGTSLVAALDRVITPVVARRGPRRRNR